MEDLGHRISIADVQSGSLCSPFAGKTVTVTGVLTGFSRRGFFIQEPVAKQSNPENKFAEFIAGSSTGIFVYLPNKTFPIGKTLRITGRIEDFHKKFRASDKPTTQIRPTSIERLDENEINLETIEPITLTASLLKQAQHHFPELLNRLEGMLVKIESGASFIQPSNHFGDYVVLPKDTHIEDLYEDAIRAKHGGIIVPHDAQIWLPSFRIISKQNAPRLNVGASLESDVTGPLHFRSQSYQLQINHPIHIKNKKITPSQSTFSNDSNTIRVMTLNCFNLDPIIETASKVKNPSTDIDDDIGSGQFRRLAEAIVSNAKCPDIVALQEIQDNDGAEQSNEVAANLTYKLLIKAITFLGGDKYRWVDIPPENQQDGGQPGGNIRNGFLYKSDSIEIVKGSVKRLANNEPAYKDTRKPLQATFRKKELSGNNKNLELTVINVHLASKRHQQSLFSPDRPRFDPKEQTRIEQARFLQSATQALQKQNHAYYITGDFNDLEGSATLTALLNDANGKVTNTNLIQQLPKNERYDYNHRGKLHVLMHGIVSKELAESGRASYEILHGNELIGVTPGQEGGRGSDHAYVVAKFSTNP